MSDRGEEGSARGSSHMANTHAGQMHIRTTEKGGRQRQIKGALKNNEHGGRNRAGEDGTPEVGWSVLLLLRDGKQLVSVKVAAIKKQANRKVMQGELHLRDFELGAT